jgi:tetratricopeptide (TPR) repeat protein
MTIVLGQVPQDDGMAQRTLAAWNQYQANRLPGGDYWEEVVFRRDAIQRLNLQNVDPDLITYYRLLEQKLTEEIPVFKAWTADGLQEDAAARYDARDAECERAHELHQPCERDSTPRPSSSGSGAAEKKWGPVIDRIEAKYTPAMAAALMRLEIKYDFTFYSDTFDKEANEHFKIAMKYMEQKKYDEAVVQLKWALRINPNNLQAHLALGRLYEESGQYELAISELRESARLHVRYADSQAEIGWCYYSLKRYADAINPLVEAIRVAPSEGLDKDPAFANLRYYLGYSLAQVGRLPEAMEQYRILQRMDVKLAGKLYEEINKNK